MGEQLLLANAGHSYQRTTCSLPGLPWLPGRIRFGVRRSIPPLSFVWLFLVWNCEVPNSQKTRNNETKESGGIDRRTPNYFNARAGT
jgi:hypothetical protein